MVRKISVHQLRVQAYAYVFVEGELYSSPNWEDAKSRPKRIVILRLSLSQLIARHLTGFPIQIYSAFLVVPFEPKLWESLASNLKIQTSKIKDPNRLAMHAHEHWRCMPTSLAILSVFFIKPSDKQTPLSLNHRPKDQHTHTKIFKLTLHSLGQILGKSQNVREFKT